MTVGDKIKSVMKEQNIKQVELANKLGIYQSLLNKYLSGNLRMPSETVSNISRILNVPIGYFFDEPVRATKPINIIGCASCGVELTDTSCAVGSQVQWRADFWHKEMFAVVAYGDSMSPEIEDGDEVICDPTAPIMNGDLVYYKVNGDDSAIKVFYKDDEAYIIQLIPYNSNEIFKTRTIRMDDVEFESFIPAKVVGINKMSFRNRASRLKLIGRG